MKSLLIIGAGGHGKVVADAALLAGWTSIAFIDARWPQLTRVGDWPVIGSEEQLEQILPDWQGVFVAVGDNKARDRLILRLKATSVPLVNVFHPSAVISPLVKMGQGVLVAANAVVNIHAEIADGVIINSAAIVEHDCRVGRSAHVSPAASLAGDVKIGDRSWVGMGSCLIPGVRVGVDVVIGAGAVVVKSIPDRSLAFGVPAQIKGVEELE